MTRAMAISLPSSTIDIAFIFALLLFLFSLWSISTSIFRRNCSQKKKPAPEAGGSWPLIGHLHLLGGPNPPHKVLGNMADKYGPLFTIKMGVHQVLVVSNWETAKECLTTNDRALAGRPKALASKILGYENSMFGLSPYGPYWRQLRKIATLELLSNQRLENFKDMREYEVRTSIKELYKFWGQNKDSSNNVVLVNMDRWFGDVTLNVILRMVVGKSTGYITTEGGEENRELKKGLKDFFELMGRFVVSDALPFLRWLDIGGYEKAMKRTAKELDLFVSGWLKEHKQKRASGGIVKGEEDFMDLMLDNIVNNPHMDLEGRDSDTVNKANCLSLVLAGADSTTVTLIWALSLLVNNPEVLEKAQLELDSHIGWERQVKESDMKNLVYLNAIIKETQRLYPAGPLGVPHESMEDCTVGDFHIPAGTRFITNLWKIHRDPRVWSSPCEFQPERFLTIHKDFDVGGQIYEYMPFGNGRRMCPGMSFALQVMQLTLATFLHQFDFKTPSGGHVDMKEDISLNVLKATPLEVLITPRLPSHLYK